MSSEPTAEDERLITLGRIAAAASSWVGNRDERDLAAIPQRVDQLEDAVMNLSRLYQDVKAQIDALTAWQHEHVNLTPDEAHS